MGRTAAALAQAGQNGGEEGRQTAAATGAAPGGGGNLQEKAQRQPMLGQMGRRCQDGGESGGWLAARRGGERFAGWLAAWRERGRGRRKHIGERSAAPAACAAACKPHPPAHASMRARQGKRGAAARGLAVPHKTRARRVWGKACGCAGSTGQATARGQGASVTGSGRQPDAPARAQDGDGGGIRRGLGCEGVMCHVPPRNEMMEGHP